MTGRVKADIVAGRVKAEIVAVGTELLLGDIVNGNAAWLGRELAEIGVDVEFSYGCRRQHRRVSPTCFGSPANVPTLSLVTGGLGPTQDDLTREALAALAGVRLIRDPAARSGAAALVTQRAGRSDFPPNNLRMADRPESAIAVAQRGWHRTRIAHADRSRRASSSMRCLACRSRCARSLATPIRAELAERAGPGQILMLRRLRTIGIWESEVSNALAHSRRGARNPAWESHAGISRIAGSDARCASPPRRRPMRRPAELIAGVEAHVRAALGDVIYGADDVTLESVVHDLLALPRATVATAESLTGGLLGAALSLHAGRIEHLIAAAPCSTPRSSRRRSAASDPTLLDQRGPVDAEVAAALADGVRQRFGATFGLATTGVAGPTQQDGVPVGTVFVALVGPGGSTGRDPATQADR